MRIIRHRSVLFCVAVAALLVPTLTGAVPSAAAVRSAAVSSCDTVPAFLGVHGMNEGPDPTDQSKGLSALLGYLDDAQNNISGAVFIDPISYHATSIGDLVLNITNEKATVEKAVHDGEQALQEELLSYTHDCKPSQDKIVLVGYSMGAWVVNKWLVDYSKEWNLIKGVLLYADPCWSHGSDEGLARIFGLSGCMPASSYPAPVAGAKFGVPLWAWCSGTPRDPVCGQGYSAKGSTVNTATQEKDAAVCAVASCPHEDYWYAGASSGDLVDGAKYMVKWLGVPELA